jgi:hypothetical protein
MYSVVSRHRQGGTIIVTVALVMLFLLGFMGIALDFGRLFIVKTELQTAMDSCALSAAQELDGQSDAIDRARSAGLSAGNLNNVNLQSANWSSQGQITAAEITFRDVAYAATTAPIAARYAQCQHTQPNVQMWLLHIMGAFSGPDPAYANTRNVFASAVATRGSAQSTCPIPIALKPNAGGSAPNYGFVVGEWVTLLHGQNAAQGGEIGWANLDGSNNASQTEAEMNGFCGTEIGDELGTPGVEASIADAWNARFGIYKNNSGPTANRPDLTGYAYTSQNWPSEQNAYNGTPEAGAHATAENFVTKRLANASCASNGRVKGADGCESITGLSLNGGFQTLATPGPTGEHRQHGFNRRIVTVPVINDASQVIDYACMLMLHPMPIPMDDVVLEFIGNAGDPGSPCTTSGSPGGSAGPLVPVLVR